MSLERFKDKALRVISEFRDRSAEEVILIHHDDADGLASAAIIKASIEREGCHVRTLCLEKPYPEVIKSIHEGYDKIIFYVDIGSSHADLISNLNMGRNLTIILDHHDPRPSNDPKLYDLNLEHYGFRGEEDFSGATICYLFSKLMSEKNIDLSYLALVGSCEIPGEFRGVNKLVLEEAISNGVVQIRRGKARIVKFGLSVDNLFSKLQILGPVGYYENGPAIGISVCLNGLTKDAKRKIDELEIRRKRINKMLLAKLYRERLNETDHIQWFDVGDMYAGMGSKVIGQFCSFLSYQRRLIKPDKFILGIMNLQDEIPSWGKLKRRLVKASVRVPRELRRLIDEGEAPSAVDLLVRASEGFGMADGHVYAASVVLPAEKKKTLIDNAEEVVKSSIKP